MAAAVIGCCSASHSPQNFVHCSWRFSEFNQKIQIYRKHSLPFKVERPMISFFGDALFQAFTYPARKTLIFKMPRSKGRTYTILPDKGVLIDIGNQSIEGLGMVSLVTIAIMLIIPSEALAETCDTDNSIFNMPLLLSVSLIGAIVGGLLARARRGELQRLNEQLRQINTALRRQAKIESYAPNLSYAPVGGRTQEKEVIVDPNKEELISHLKSGKNYLRNQDLDKAFEKFKTALNLARQLKDPLEEKKAARGLGASLQRQGRYEEAIKYQWMVLAISERQGDVSGNTEAYGAIADCYTEIGDLERAAKFYDMYIARLQQD